PGVDYPIVGLIDTGIIENHRLLEPWIYQRVSYIPNEYKNHKHATFIGGILASGDTFNRYNHHSTGLEGVKILDVCTIPNDDPNQASVDFLSEDDLITRLRDVVPQFKNQVKFWNLSLGSDTTCSLDSFSDLAIAVDSIQAENSVMFVIASGNDVNLPVREWPPQPIIRDRDILCPPADSLRGMTTGSIAGIDNQHTVVKRNHPSPFSRRGFGPNFVVKPDLVTYGGNCNDRIQPCNSGVISIDEAGNLVEGIGTSYAAPYATALIASIYKAYGGQISLNLCKALVLHSCYHPETLGVPDRNDMPYYGFGLPGHFSTILTGTRSNATIIYEHQLAEGMDIQIPDFPFPNCLVRNEKCYGEILMTLVYDPPLDANYGLEYCRVNIDAALGRYSQKIDKDTGEIKEVFNAEIPHLPQIKARETKDLFERRLIEYGFKWSPVKRYYKKLNGIENKRWGLQVRMHVRSEETGVLAQSFALVISFRDPTGGDVYGDLRKTINRPSMELSIEERIKAALGV
ncbi:MAG: S8 family peptidase, partial [Chitinophagales bacterium]